MLNLKKFRQDTYYNAILKQISYLSKKGLKIKDISKTLQLSFPRNRVPTHLAILSAIRIDLKIKNKHVFKPRKLSNALIKAIQSSTDDTFGLENSEVLKEKLFFHYKINVSSSIITKYKKKFGILIIIILDHY